MTSQSDTSPVPAEDGAVPPPVAPPTPTPLAAPTTPPIPGPAPDAAPVAPPAPAFAAPAAPIVPPAVPAASPFAPPAPPIAVPAAAPAVAPPPPAATPPAAPQPLTAPTVGLDAVSTPPSPGGVPTYPPQPGVADAAPAAPRRKRPIALIIILSLLFVVLAGVIVYLALYLSAVLGRLDEAIDRIDEQQEIIDSKETFSAAMQELVDTARQFDGMPYATIISNDELRALAASGWENRRNPSLVAADVEAVRAETESLRAILTAAADQAATNASGTAAEAAVDALGSGFVTTAYDDADSLCESDVLGCVTSADPYVVHLDAADQGLEWMTERIWTGVAYHEFAHVMQYTNPEQTEVAEAAFGGDWETMADCFALTYLDGWALDQRVYVTSYSWYDVSVGYGYTCDASQSQAVTDWYDSVGYRSEPISQ